MIMVHCGWWIAFASDRGHGPSKMITKPEDDHGTASSSAVT